MLDKEKVACYFISLDRTGKYFNKKLMNKNGRNLYEGNARLNKMMHLAQNIYFAMTDNLLIDADFYAYDNGAVIPQIQENYWRLLEVKGSHNFDMNDAEKTFFNKIYFIFKDAPIDELIEIDHEDPEWRKKHSGYSKAEQKMDTRSNLADYKVRYNDIIRVITKLEDNCLYEC